MKPLKGCKLRREHETTRQIEREASRGEKASSIFSDNGYRIMSYEKGQVSVACKIHIGKRYNALDLIIYKTTAVEKIREDRGTVSKLSHVLLYRLVNIPNSLIRGLELRNLFGVKTPYYMGKQAMIVADKFLVSGSRGEGDDKRDSVEIVPISNLSSVLESRKKVVLKKAKRIFKPNKGEVLNKAYSRARSGLIITILLIATLVPFLFFNLTGSFFQSLMVVDSILLVVTLIGSIIIHESGVARFKKLLREELAAFQKLPEGISKKFGVEQIDSISTSQPFIREEPSTETRIKKPVEPLITTSKKNTVSHTQQVDDLLNIAQKTYAEGDWEESAIHLNNAVICALKDAYVKLTGNQVFGDILKVGELVFEKTGVDYNRFKQFYDRTINSKKITEAELAGLNEYAQELLATLRSSVIATATFEDKSTKKSAPEIQRELPTLNGKDPKIIPLERTVKTSNVKKPSKSKAAKKSREKVASKTGLKESISTVSTESDIISCDSVVEVMCVEENIKGLLKNLIDSRKGLVDYPAFLIITQSTEVMSVVEELVQKYPGVPIGTYERAVNGKAQIIVSRDGGISSKIDYESPKQLEKLIIDQTGEKPLNQLKPTGSIEDYFGLLNE